MQILAVLASGSADFTRLQEESGISKATLWRRIKKFKEQAMLLSQNDEYELPHDLKDIREFLEHYCSYFAVSTMKEISPAGNFIAAKGFEFLFSLKEESIHENVRSTGLTSISEEIPLMLAENYYFYTSRTLSREEIAVHAIVADPHSKRNLTYVIMYILKAKLDMARVKFDEKYVFDELEKVADALTSPVTLYLLGGAAMIKYGLKAATKEIDVLLSTLEEIGVLYCRLWTIWKK